MYTVKQVRNFQLLKQHLISPKEEAFSEEALLSLLSSIGYVQLDSINVTNARSQDIFLWSRFAKYNNKDYTNLYAQGRFVEVYLSALSLMTHDSTIVSKLQLINLFKMQNDINYPHFLKIFNKLVDAGPTYKKDFVQNRNSAQWHLSEEDNAIDKLWRAGLIKVTRDSAFRKIIEARKTDVNSIFKDINTIKLQLCGDLVRLAFNNLGVATKSEVFRSVHMPKALFDQAFNEAIQKQQILKVAVEGESNYILATDLDTFNENALYPHDATLLTPFDNLIRDRDRTLRIFSFNYKLESYIPRSQRTFGYFALPILINGEIVGTVDLRFNKKQRKLDIDRLVWQNKFKNNKYFITVFYDIISNFDKFVSL